MMYGVLDVNRTQERLQNAIRLLHETKRLEGQRCRDDVATLQRVISIITHIISLIR